METLEKEGAREVLLGWRHPGAHSGTFSDCSLVVATYKRPQEVRKLIEALRQLPDLPAEVVIVDGSPDEATGEALTDPAQLDGLPFDLVYVRSPAGLTRQRNVGIDASRGRYLFFLDDDCLPEPGYFRNLRAVLVEDRALQVGAVSGSFVGEAGQDLGWRWRLRFWLGIVPRGEPGRYYPTGTSIPRGFIPAFTGCRSVEMVPGGASVYRREVLLQHRFSKFFYGYAQGEDLEMSLRIGRTWKLLWSGDARVLHNHVASGRPSSVQKGRMEVRNRYFIWRRHSPQVRWKHRVLFWTDIALILALDLGGYAAHPTKSWYLSHAWGIISGACSCWTATPEYNEPPAAAEYELHLTNR